MQKKSKTDKKVVTMLKLRNGDHWSMETMIFVISVGKSPRKHVERHINAKIKIRQHFGHHLPIWQR